MRIPARYVSPDGQLAFVVVKEGDDTILGFDIPEIGGFNWHTHGDLLVGEEFAGEILGESEEGAVERFVELLLQNKLPIVISRRGGEIYDIGITDDPEAEKRHTPEGETVEFRFWDTEVESE